MQLNILRRPIDPQKMFLTFADSFKRSLQLQRMRVMWHGCFRKVFLHKNSRVITLSSKTSRQAVTTSPCVCLHVLYFQRRLCFTLIFITLIKVSSEKKYEHIQLFKCRTRSQAHPSNLRYGHFLFFLLTIIFKLEYVLKSNKLSTSLL